MPPDVQKESPVIVCPLRYEMRMLRRRLKGNRFAWLCCGPGAQGIQRAAAQIGQTRRMVILAGLAGGLNPQLQAGSAAIVTDVVDTTSGQRWTPTAVLKSPARGTARCAVTSAASSVNSVDLKRELFMRSKADLVDLESVAFASAAGLSGWNWGIVRAVSDGAGETLPAAVDGWVDDRGRTRPIRVGIGLIFHPTILPAVLRLKNRSHVAILGVADLIFEGLTGHSAETGGTASAV